MQQAHGSFDNVYAMGDLAMQQAHGNLVNAMGCKCKKLVVILRQ